MKILYHHRIRSKDGQYVHMRALIDALQAQGHEVVICGPRAVESADFGADAGWVARLKRGLPRALYEALELAYCVVAALRLLAFALWHRPDAIYERYNLFLPSGVWVKRGLRLPLLLEVNAPLYEERSRYGGLSLHRLARWSQRYAWRGADRVLPVTRVLAECVQCVAVPSSRIVVIPNGVNAEEFAAVPDRHGARRYLGLRDEFVLGFVGFVREWHGLERVLQLIAEARQRDQNWTLLIVGDGPARRGLEQTARALNVADRVTLTGVIARREVPLYINAFDVALQPAVVGYASPLKLLEYLALGCAIVAPATPNLREILVDGDNALLFDPGRPISMNDKIRRLHEDIVLREKIRAGARRTIEDRGLTWRNNASTVAALYRELGVAAVSGARQERPI